jgi:hypothetical protein
MARRRERGALPWWLVGLIVLFAGDVARGSKGGAMLTFAQLRDLASRVGFPSTELDTAAAVALAESGGNVLARGDSGQSFGLWQVNLPAHPEFTPQALLDAEGNARAALAIFQKAGWAMWSTFKNGAYKAHLPKGTP